jgi:hypothetical protein
MAKKKATKKEAPAKKRPKARNQQKQKPTPGNGFPMPGLGQSAGGY